MNIMKEAVETKFDWNATNLVVYKTDAMEAATDTQSVIESIAGDGAATTIVTVDHLEVSVEMDDPDRPPSSTGSVAC